MKVQTTKYFYFSASHENGGKIRGHNYVLGVVMDAPDPALEAALERKVEESLIRKLQSRDLGLDVDFLKGIEITDANLLRVFWDVLKKGIAPFPLRALSLERDRRTTSTLFE